MSKEIGQKLGKDMGHLFSFLLVMLLTFFKESLLSMLSTYGSRVAQSLLQGEACDPAGPTGTSYSMAMVIGSEMGT